MNSICLIFILLFLCNGCDDGHSCRECDCRERTRNDFSSGRSEECDRCDRCDRCDFSGMKENPFSPLRRAEDENS